MASTYLTRTIGTTGNRKTFTYSTWIKRGNIGSYQPFMGDVTDAGNDYFTISFQSGDHLNIYSQLAGPGVINISTNKLFRDTSAWYHIVVATDTTQATASNRVKIYVNGVQETSFSVATYPNQNTDLAINISGETQEVGAGHTLSSNTFDGSMSHVHFIDGTAYDATAFGQYDANGVWTIKTSPSVTYGTNGFFILKDGNSVTDQSGNSNNLTVAGGTLTNTEDNPSNVFATFNPLARSTNSHYANGNTTYDYANNYQKTTSSTLATNNKKIYAEFKILRSTTIHLGIVGDTFISDGRTVNDTSASWSYDMRGHTGGIALQTASNTGSIYIDGSYSSTNVDFTTTTNDIVMIAFDPTTKKIWWGKNGTWSSSGNPATGANASYTYSGTATSDFCFAVASEGSSAGAISANFGNGYFGTTAVASAGTNASGIGIFEYDVPTGYTALSTKGLNL
jgi:hypothetical protein